MHTSVATLAQVAVPGALPCTVCSLHPHRTMAPRCSILSVAVAAASLGLARAACDPLKAAEAPAKCPVMMSLNGADPQGETMTNLIKEICDAGVCKTLMDDLKLNCKGQTGMEWLSSLSSLDAMCGTITTCPVVGGSADMLWASMMAPCPKMMKYGATSPAENATIPADVVTEVCDAGKCFDMRTKITDLCKGNSVAEEALAGLTKQCKKDGTSGSYALPRGLALASTLASLLTAWAQ